MVERYFKKSFFSSSKLSEEDERKRARRLRLGLSPTIDESGNNRDSIGAASDQSGSSEEATTESPPTSPPKQSSITPPNEPDIQRPTSRTDVKPDDEPGEIIVSPRTSRRRRPDQRPNVPYHMQTKQSDVDSFYDMPKTKVDNHEDNLNAETALWKREEGAERQLRPKADSLHEPDSDLEATRNALEDLESEIADLRVTPDPIDPADEGFPEPPSAEKLEESLLDASKTDDLDFFYKKPSPVGDPDELNDDGTSQDDSQSCSSRPETPSTDNQTEKTDTSDLPSGNVKDKLNALNKMACAPVQIIHCQNNFFTFQL